MNKKLEQFINQTNGGIIGIGVNGQDDWAFMQVFEGYDGSSFMDDWTAEDKDALADFMIAKWQEWKDKQ